MKKDKPQRKVNRNNLFVPSNSPGHADAIKAGCKCPHLDNNWGAGIGMDENGERLFVINFECPIHGQKEEKP